MNHKFQIVLVTVMLAGCASTEEMANVIPGEGGTYEVVATGEDKQETLASALEAARSTCEERQMRFVVLNRKETLMGVVPVNGEDAGSVAAEVAARTAIEHTPLLIGDEYRVTMRFKCEA